MLLFLSYIVQANYTLKQLFMKLKIVSLLLPALTILYTAQSQGFLKKVKEKVSGKTETPTAKESNNEKPDNKIAWCDTVIGKINTVAYTMAYSSPNSFTILYDESCLGMGIKKTDYRLILQQQVDRKTQYVIVDNGKITATVSEIKNDQILCGIHSSFDGFNTEGNKKENQKYIVAITSTTTVAAQNSKTVTTAQKIDADKVATGYEMAKNTEEYKKLSPEEKKQMDEMMKQMPQMAKDYNNSGMAGKTITTPEVKGGTYTVPTGYYNIVVKGKNYGKFMGQPYLAVSDDEANVYIVASDDKGKTSFIVNDKKLPMGGKDVPGSYHNPGELLLSPDGKKAAYIEQTVMTESEQQEMIKALQNGGTIKQSFIITKSNGSSFQTTRTDGNNKFRLTNSGAIVYVNVTTGEVFADGKSIGKFNTGTEFNSSALLLGNDPSKICYYNEDGSLSYLDGSKKNMGILFPRVIPENGKNYIAWFRKCKNEIYIGKFEF